MNTQSEFNSQDLVFRMLDGAHKGALLPVSTRKCLMGDNIGTDEEDSSHLVILRGPDGAAIQSHGSEVFVNGTPVTCEWLKQGDQIQFGKTKIEVVQLGSFSEPESTQPTEEEAEADNTRNEELDKEANALKATLDAQSQTMPQNGEDVDNRVDILTNTLSSLTTSLDEQPAETSQPCPSEGCCGGSASCEKPVEIQTPQEEQIFSPLNNVEAPKAELPAMEVPVAPQPEMKETEQPAVQLNTEPETADDDSAAREAELARVFASIGQTEEPAKAAPKPVAEPVAETTTPNLDQVLNSINQQPQQEEVATPVPDAEAERESELARVMESINMKQEEPKVEAPAANVGSEADAEVAKVLASLNLPQQEPAVEAGLNVQPMAETQVKTSFEQPAAQLEAGLNHMEPQANQIVGLTPLSEIAKQFAGCFEAGDGDEAASVVGQLESTNDSFGASPTMPSMADSIEQPVVQQPVVNVPAANVPDTNVPVVQQPVVDVPAAQEPAVEIPVVEDTNPIVESSAAVDNSAEQRLRDVFSQLREEKPNEIETEQEEPQAETPQVEEAHVEEPQAEAPQVEAPKAESTESGNESVADLLARMQAEGQLDAYDSSDDDAVESEAVAETPEPVVEVTPETVEPVSESEAGEAGGEDSSVQDYMNRLLGRTDSEESTQGKANKASEEQAVAAAAIKKKAEPVKILKASEYKPSKKAPEKTKNLSAFRELANQSNRVALAKSNSQRVKVVTMTNIAVMILGLLLAIYLFMSANGEQMSMILGGATLLLSLGLGAYTGRGYMKHKSALNS